MQLIHKRSHTATRVLQVNNFSRIPANMSSPKWFSASASTYGCSIGVSGLLSASTVAAADRDEILIERDDADVLLKVSAERGKWIKWDNKGVLGRLSPSDGDGGGGGPSLCYHRPISFLNHSQLLCRPLHSTPNEVRSCTHQKILAPMNHLGLIRFLNLNSLIRR